MNKMDITMNQASGLRNMQRNHRIKVVAVTGGKGGVGKSNVTLNVGMSLAAQGKRVLILDFIKTYPMCFPDNARWMKLSLKVQTD